MRGMMTAAVLLACAATARGEGAMTFKPKVQEPGAGAFRCTSAPAVLVGRGLQKAPDAYAPLLAGLQARSGSAVEAQPVGASLPATPYILVGLTRDRAELRSLVAGLGKRLPRAGLGDEGFAIDVSPERVLVVAKTPAGAQYGVRALLDMAGERGFEVAAGRTADWPTMKWRGMHVLAYGTSGMPALERLIGELLPRYRMNKLIVEVDYGFRFKSHPEVAATEGLTREDCRKLVALARRNYIELIPQFQCLGHQSWARRTGELLTMHPEFDETPDLPQDNPGIYCRSWCPNHPGINRFVFDLFDELIDAFDAKSFHVGMDEVFILGKCGRCKDTPVADLFAKAVNDYHAHLVGKRRVTMMMWGDRLLDAKEMGYSEWEASADGVAPAIGLAPKDIVLCDWHYAPVGAFKSVKYIQDQGFRVWPSGWNSKLNAHNLASKALDNMSPKMMGYLATTWFGVDTLSSALAGEPITAKERESLEGVVDAIRTGSQLAWEGKPAK